MVTCPICHCEQTSIAFQSQQDLSCIRCTHCSLQFLHPQPSAELLQTIYDKEYYSPWLQDTGNDGLEEMKQQTFYRYLQLVQLFQKDGKLLDIGCAMGALLLVAKDLGFDPNGVELNAIAVQAAQEHLDNIHCGTLEEVKFDDETFDVVTMTDLIEHVSDPAATAKEVSRILKPDGIILVVTPNVNTLNARLLGKHWPHHKTEHLFYFNRKSLRRCFADFEILRMQSVRKSLTPLYIGNILQRYSTLKPMRWLGHISAAAGKRIWNPKLRIKTGELLMIARKNPQDLS